MVGRLPDARRAGRLGFQNAGEEIALVGPFTPSLAASELEKLRGEPLPDGLAELDVDAVRAAQVAVREAVRAGMLSSAHDVAEGGLAVALAECCLAGKLGAEVRLSDEFWETISLLAPGQGSASPVSGPVTAALFGEGSGGFVVSGETDALGKLGEGVRLLLIGTVGGDALRILDGRENVVDGGENADGTMVARIVIPLAELTRAHARLGELFS
jgi:phosphoribosylformylglycinamidine (FGAM) synthase-like enzyme